MEESVDRLSIFENWLVGEGVAVSIAAMMATAAGVLVVVILAMIANLVAKRVLLRAVVTLAEHTETSWDDVLTERRVFHRLAHVAPALVLYFFAPAVLGTDASATRVVTAGCLLYMVVVIVSVLDRVLNATVDIVRASRFGRGVPLTSFAQVAKLVLYGVAFIVALSVLIGESPVVLLGGLGVMATLLMLVFQDAILGFVAGIQLSANKMVTPGDWIEMPKYGADGDVLEVALTTVKVQNFDKTITTVPTYALISESFKNWRGMSESGGRRIKRAINIDMSSIRFCDDAMLERLSRIHYMADYLEEKRGEIETWNATHEGEPGDLAAPPAVDEHRDLPCVCRGVSASSPQDPPAADVPGATAGADRPRPADRDLRVQHRPELDQLRGHSVGHLRPSAGGRAPVRPAGLSASLRCP